MGEMVPGKEMWDSRGSVGLAVWQTAPLLCVLHFCLDLCLKKRN